MQQPAILYIILSEVLRLTNIEFDVLKHYNRYNLLYKNLATIYASYIDLSHKI